MVVTGGRSARHPFSYPYTPFCGLQKILTKRDYVVIDDILGLLSRANEMATNELESSVVVDQCVGGWTAVSELEPRDHLGRPTYSPIPYFRRSNGKYKTMGGALMSCFLRQLYFTRDQGWE